MNPPLQLLALKQLTDQPDQTFGMRGKGARLGKKDNRLQSAPFIKIQKKRNLSSRK